MTAIKLLGPDGAELPPVQRPLGARMGELHDGYHGARRGSPYEGASTVNPDIAGYNPFNFSAQTALSFSRDRLVARLHDAARNDGWASIAVTRQVDQIIGAGWTLRAKPSAEGLGIEVEETMDLARQIEAAWKLYSEDPDECDVGARLTVGGIQALAMRHRCLDGESLGVNHWVEDQGEYCTKHEVIDPDRLSNPWMFPDLYWRRQGVEINERGAPLVYNIRCAHPGDLAVVNPKFWRWERIERRLPNGRQQVCHAFEPNRAGAVRGEPPLAPILKKLHMLGKYDAAELQAAVINALLAAVVYSGSDHEQIAEALQGSDGLSKLQDGRIDFYKKEKPLSIPGAQISYLYPTDKLDLTKPSHPNSGFEAFYKVGLRNVAAAAGVMYEQLTGDHSGTNYSSYRGALLTIYQGLISRSGHWAPQHMRPFYACWLEEAIALGKVKPSKRAPEFRKAKAAWCGAKWIGPARGWVDQLKEAQAALARISSGLSTYEKECADQGEWYLDVFRQRARERAEMIDLGLDPDLLIRSALPRGSQAGAGAAPPEPKEPPSEKEEADEDIAAGKGEE